MVVREVDGEILVLDTVSNRIHQLNRTASIVWRMTGKGALPHTVAAALTAEFEVDEQTALDDVVEILARLRSLNLLAGE